MLACFVSGTYAENFKGQGLRESAPEGLLREHDLSTTWPHRVPVPGTVDGRQNGTQRS
jgi:hypothetical protein